jgi:hypothetical protein
VTDPLDLCTCGHLLAEHPTDGRRCSGGAVGFPAGLQCACEAFTVQGASTPIDPPDARRDETVARRFVRLTADLDGERASHARTQHALDVLFDLTQGALAGRACASDELAEANAALADWGAFDLDLHALLAERLGELPGGVYLIDAIRLMLDKAQTAAFAEGRKDQADQHRTEFLAAVEEEQRQADRCGAFAPTVDPEMREIAMRALDEIEAEDRERRQALIDLIDGEYVASCLAQDDRTAGSVALAIILDPLNRDVVIAALVSGGFPIEGGA